MPRQEVAPIDGSPKNQIIFLSLSIYQDSSRASRVIRVENLVKKPGVLKSRGPATWPAGPFLTCTLFSGSQPLDTLYQEHPLFKNQEYVNNQNQFARKAISLDQAAFFIRFHQMGADHLRIEEKLPGRQAQELISIKL